ncbi:nucleoside-diphosphate sugar epimerase/dehydratase [Aestuariirhabdus litorea]|uniref:Polysaccharide biosynthesis protein n=1 Tax=Aestuariirhabdus litorea TaxID=2528527 RepID=A0A3P3VS09_9GAMM|nr:nucleoside-diphosphate sugar epimerase/dehydratase [Aestuariirhabdus litorea]RRJ84486.1 polysaccharide biosynthesis protein [Aestuariirhabdus litorea]RWW97710.1 NAD-dependent epimerase/dehydratase family protein [Endozoicomonadaceae bacterium GTF-13]
MNKLRSRLINLSRRQKRVIQVSIDIPLVWIALYLGLLMRLGWEDMPAIQGAMLNLFIGAAVIVVFFLVNLGLYRSVTRFLGLEGLWSLFKAVTLSVLALSFIVFWFREYLSVPRSSIFNFWWLSMMLIGGVRLAMRHYLLAAGSFLQSGLTRQYDNLPKVAIYGAGAAGNQLLAALRNGLMVKPVAFIDDDNSIATRTIAGLKVYKPKHLQEVIDEHGISEVLLAIPSVSRTRKREIIESLQPYPLHVRTVPGIEDIAAGRVEVSDLREVDIADLLGREEVPPVASLLERCISGQVVLVTGAGGSIGSELCRQIVRHAPKSLLLYDHCEFSLYSIHSELEQVINRDSMPIELVAVLGSVRDTRQINKVMKGWQVDTVYHAAAYKHVPMVEHNVAEGVYNNLFGTLNTALAALESGVTNFVLISTDKAVRPTNVMGATKRLSEMVLQALAAEAYIELPKVTGLEDTASVENRTRFTMVRFGNVLGSSGSVIPRFRSQLKHGGPITVTHPKITRYFMTIPEAAQLVIQAGSMGKGGDVFVLDMGEPVEILDLARRMILLSGLSVKDDDNPQGDISIEFTGLRPGEKLYEELLIGEGVQATEHPKIMTANEKMLSWCELQEMMKALEVQLAKNEITEIRKTFSSVVDGYRSEGGVVDGLFLRSKIGC